MPSPRRCSSGALASRQWRGTAIRYTSVAWGLFQKKNTTIDSLHALYLRVMKDFDDQRKAGVKIPVFDPEKFADLDIDKSAWQLTERPSRK